MQFMTDFGDEAVILPLFFCVTMMFYAMGWKRGGMVWSVGITGLLVSLVLIKILGLCWGEVFGFKDRPFSMSGHVMASAVVYGTLANVFFYTPHRLRFILFLPPLLVALGIGYTRFYLCAHTLTEILSATVLGVVGSVVLSDFLSPVPGNVQYYGVFMPLCVVLLTHGYVFHSEKLLQSLFYNSYHVLPKALIW